jgi:transcription antitermination factor NusA-like protein
VDGSLSDAGMNIWTTAINKVNLPTSSKPRDIVHECSCDTANTNQMVTEFVSIPKESIGSIIGKRGHNIRELTKTFDVSMSVGKWVEKSKGSASDEYIDKSDAVIITGRADLVCKSAEKVAQLANEVNEPNSKKIRL